jgi:hypothetical protein
VKKKTGGHAMPRLSEVGCFLAVLLATSAVTASDAKVLRNKYNTATVWVFKNADALWRLEKVANVSVYDEKVIAPLVACEAPRGSKVDVLGTGYRTAFVRVTDGIASGCVGTVPLRYVRDQ